MKFRFRPSKAKIRLPQSSSVRKRLILKGSSTLCKVKQTKLSINYTAKDFGKLSETEEAQQYRSVFGKIATFLTRIKEYILAKAKKKGKNTTSLPTLAGILCSAFLICAISGLTVVSFMFFRYNRNYTTVTVPNLLYLSKEEALSTSNDIFEYSVIYKENPDYPDGVVTAQSPLPEVTRKVYGNEKKKLVLTVNSSQPLFSMPELRNTSLRDALLLLKREGINVTVVKEYSNTVNSGNIIYCSSPKGSTLKNGDHVTVYASLGKEKLKTNVPKLLGLSESDAIAILEKNNLSSGEISYVASKEPIGTVISQSISYGTYVFEKTEISFTVSGGIYYLDNT